MAVGSPAATAAGNTVREDRFTAPDNGRTCRSSDLPVTLDLGNPAFPNGTAALPGGDQLGAQHVYARMCTPDGVATRAVQVLVHGITYDHRYWNSADPADPGSDRYSWEAAAAHAGYATLSIDRIGNGRSSRPPSPAVNITSNADVVRQVVRQLRSGKVPAPAGGAAVAYDKVILVGHSYGSMTAWTAADGNADIAALVLTSATHNIQEFETPFAIESSLYPAVLDPAWADKMLDPGYVTPRDGTIDSLYYAPSTNFDRRMLMLDQEKKGTVSQSELFNYPLIFRTRMDIRVPVFYLIGSEDGIFCSHAHGDLGADCSTAESLIANERPWLGEHVPSINAYIVPQTGHDLNNFYSSRNSFAVVHAWLKKTVAPA
jgi:pimeloyl-ACP methyl ester carboxylesterase